MTGELGSFKCHKKSTLRRYLNSFNMKDAKPMSIPLGSHFKVIKNDLSEEEKE